MTDAHGGQPPAAGWYPDPEKTDTVTYWDGTAWTDHHAPTQATRAQWPPTPTHATPLEPARDSRFNYVVGSLGLVVVCVLVVALVVILNKGKTALQICQPAIAKHLPAGNPDWSSGGAQTQDFPGGMQQVTGTVTVGSAKYFYKCQVVDGKVDKLSVAHR